MQCSVYLRPCQSALLMERLWPQSSYITKRGRDSYNKNDWVALYTSPSWRLDTFEVTWELAVQALLCDLLNRTNPTPALNVLNGAFGVGAFAAPLIMLTFEVRRKISHSLAVSLRMETDLGLKPGMRNVYFGSVFASVLFRHGGSWFGCHTNLICVVPRNSLRY